MSKNLTLTLLTIGIVLALAHLQLYANAWVDDAFITYRYSQHLAQGFGPVWNPGEIPVDGYTNFFWMLVNALGVKLGLNPLITSKALGCLSTLVIFSVSLAGCAGLLNSIGSRLLLFFLLLICPALAFYAQSGMETNLFALTNFLAVIFYLRFLRFGNNRDCYIAALIAGFASINRPEGLGVFGLIYLFELLREWRCGQLNRKRLLFTLASFLCFWLPYFIWHFLYYGFPFPNTFYAKHTGGGIEQPIQGFLYSCRACTYYLGLPLMFSVLLFTAKKKPEEADSRQKFQNYFEPENFCFFFIFGYVLYIIAVGGDASLPSYRLIVPILPITYLLAAISFDKYAQSYKTLPANLTALSLLLFVLMANITDFNFMRLDTSSGITSIKKIDIAAVRKVLSYSPIMKREEDIAGWITKKLPHGGLVALPWAGAISYYTNVDILDTVGLNDKHIAHLKKRERGIDVKRDALYVINRKPDLIFVNIHRDLATGKIPFEASGDHLARSKEMLDLLSQNKNYRFAADCPAEEACFERR